MMQSVGGIKLNIIIRKMTNKDIMQVQDVAKKSWNATYEEIIPGGVQKKFLNAAYNEEMLEMRLSRSLIFVAEAEKQVVGFADFSQVNNEGQSELGAIYLYPTWQSEGIGTALLQKGIECIDNLKEIYIDVEKENIIGRTFYEAKGFKRVKEYDDNFDGHILKTIRMVLEI